MIASYLRSQINTSDKAWHQRESRGIPGGCWAEGWAVRTTTANAGAFTHGEQDCVLSGPVCELALGAVEMRGVVSLPRPLLHAGPTAGGFFSAGLRSLPPPRHLAQWPAEVPSLRMPGLLWLWNGGRQTIKAFTVPMCLGSFILTSATRRPDCFSREKWHMGHICTQVTAWGQSQLKPQRCSPPADPCVRY